MNKTVLFVCVLMLPMAVFANVWQSYRFERLSRQVRSLETEQQRLLEENKRLIAGIAVLRSPARVRDIATRQLGLKQAARDEVITVEVGARRSDE